MDGHSSAAALPITGIESPEERLGALFDLHHERLYRLARRMTRNVDDALDLVQDTFVRAAPVRGAIPYGAAAEEAWLVRVLVNVQRDAWRRAAVRRRFAPRLAEPGAAEAPQEAALIARSVVWHALASLPPRRRAVVILRELEDLSYREIAEVLNVPVGTVMSRLSRARSLLARHLRPEGGGCGPFACWWLVR